MDFFFSTLLPYLGGALFVFVVLAIAHGVGYSQGIEVGRRKAEEDAARERERVEEWRASTPGPRAPAP